MKQIMILMLLFTSSLQAQNKLMKLNFGARTPLLRVEIGKYITSNRSQCKAYGWLGNTESGMLSNTRISAEAMAMVNNNYAKEDEMVRPKFIYLKASYDDYYHQTILSSGYAQSTTCFYKYRGYWSTGIAIKDDKTYSETNVSNRSSTGCRIAFSGYNSKTGIQAEAYVFKNERFMNILISQRTAKHCLLSIGVNHNKPIVSTSYMYKKMRFNLSVQRYQYGLSLNLNI